MCVMLMMCELIVFDDCEGVWLFKLFGWLFVLEDKGVFVEVLEVMSVVVMEEIEKAMARREYLSKVLSDVEMNLRELMNGNEVLVKEL